MIKLSKKKGDFLEKAKERVTVVEVRQRDEGLAFLVQFFHEIRPSGSGPFRDPGQNLQRAIRLLHEYPLLLTNLRNAFFSQLVNTNLNSTLTESGIPLSRGFWEEFSNRLKHKFLPPLPDKNDFLYVVQSVFFRKDDIDWVEKIPRQTWLRFFETTGLPFHIENRNLRHQLTNALKILSFQVAQLGLENEMKRYLPADMDENVFINQHYLVHEAEQILDQSMPTSEVQLILSKVKEQLIFCENLIADIRAHQSENGASISLTYMLLILSYRLQRMQLLLDVLDSDQQFDTGKLVDLFVGLVRNETRKNSIGEFLSQGFGYLAYRIAEHKGSKGDKYITSTRLEYWRMLGSAMWGGFIISFIAIFKNLLGKLAFAPFWQGFVYSLNYSAGFLIIEQTHSTLATKQPAFTASAVASSLDVRKTGTQPNLYNLAVTVAKISRSQTASFLGNLLVVFPLTFLLSWGYFSLTGTPVADTEHARALLADQHPWKSLSLLYACFTGVFLFLSGIIAGYVQNKIQYGRIAQRLEMHPWLRVSFSSGQLSRLANFIERNAGAIIGNIALGFFLGMAGIMGKIFGIHFDIRHITISAGNCAIAVEQLGIRQIDPGYLLTVFFGVLAIGFLNFLVSFSLAFMVAVKSRGIQLREYPEFIRILWKYFRTNPLDFIRPRKRLISE